MTPSFSRFLSLWSRQASKLARRTAKVRPVAMTVTTLEDRVVPAIINWDGGGGDGLWSTARNWSGDALPGSADDVRIGIGNSVAFNSVAAVKTIDSIGDLTMVGGKLTSTGGMTFHNGLTITGGTFGGFVGLLDAQVLITPSATEAFTLSVSGDTTLQGTIQSGQLIQVGGGWYNRHANLVVADGVVNHGTIDLRSVGYTYASNLTGNFTNAADGTLVVHPDNYGGRAFTGTLINRGTIDATARGLVIADGSSSTLAGGSVSGTVTQYGGTFAHTGGTADGGLTLVDTAGAFRDAKAGMHRGEPSPRRATSIR